MNMDLHRLTIHEAGDLLRRREISSLELTQACLDRIAAVDPAVRAFVTVCADGALQQAGDADRRIKNDKATPLTGIPKRSARRSCPCTAAM